MGVSSGNRFGDLKRNVKIQFSYPCQGYIIFKKFVQKIIKFIFQIYLFDLISKI